MLEPFNSKCISSCYSINIILYVYTNQIWVKIDFKNSNKERAKITKKQIVRVGLDRELLESKLLCKLYLVSRIVDSHQLVGGGVSFLLMFEQLYIALG